MPKAGRVQSSTVTCGCFGKKRFSKDEEYRKKHKNHSEILSSLQREITTQQKLAAFTDIYDLAESIALEKGIGEKEIKLHSNEQQTVASLKKGVMPDVEAKTNPNRDKKINYVLNHGAKNISTVITSVNDTAVLNKKVCREDREKKNETASIRKSIRPEVYKTNNNCKSYLENGVVSNVTNSSCIKCVLEPENKFELNQVVEGNYARTKGVPLETSPSPVLRCAVETYSVKSNMSREFIEQDNNSCSLNENIDKDLVCDESTSAHEQDEKNSRFNEAVDETATKTVTTLKDNNDADEFLSNSQQNNHYNTSSTDVAVLLNDKLEDGRSAQDASPRDFKVASRENLFVGSSFNKENPISAEQETFLSSNTLMAVIISANVSENEEETAKTEVFYQEERFVDVDTEKLVKNDQDNTNVIENDQELRENREETLLEKSDAVIDRKEEIFATDSNDSTSYQQSSSRIDSKFVVQLLIDDIISRVVEVVGHQSNLTKESEDDLTQVKIAKEDILNNKALDINKARNELGDGNYQMEENYTDITAYLESSDDERTILTPAHRASSEHSESDESISLWSRDATPNNSPRDSCDDDYREINVNSLGTSQSYAGETSMIVSSGSSLQCDVNANCTKDFDEDQIKIIADLLYDVNDVLEARGLGPVSTSTVVRFLEARDYDVNKAFKLFLKYQEQQNLLHVKNPFGNPLKDELVSGRFTVLEPNIKADEAAITVFYAQRLTSQTDYNVVLQSICFQLDEVLRNEVVRKNGIIFLYDFTNVSFKSSNLRLCVKIFNLLGNIYPVKLKTTFIISPPFWFKTTMNTLSNILKELNHVQITNREQLLQSIAGSRIPESLGGTLRHNHVSWINQCLYAHSKRRGLGKEVLKPRHRLAKSSLSAPNSRMGARFQKEGID